MKNQDKLNSNKEVIIFLADQFPLCFTTTGQTKPLKIGIFQDLVKRVQGENNISKTQLRSALRLYTLSWRYLYGIQRGEQRVDLDGYPCGKPEIKHISHARKQLKEAKIRIQLIRATQEEKKRKNTTVSVPQSSSSENNIFKKDSTMLHTSSIQQKCRLSILRQTMSPLNITPIKDISKLQIGQTIKVKVGKTPMNAILMEITKEGVRVQLSSGMALIVRTEHLRF